MHLVGGQPSGSTDGIVVGKLHVRLVGIPKISSLVDNHSEHVSHGVVHALDAAVAVRMIGACCNSALAVWLVNRVRQLGKNWSPLLKSRITGHPHRGIYVFTRMSAVLSAVNSATETACMHARRLKRSVRHFSFSRGRKAFHAPKP